MKIKNMAYWKAKNRTSPIKQHDLQPIGDIMTVLGGGSGDVEQTEEEKEKGGYYSTGGGSTGRERILKKVKDYRGRIHKGVQF